ncbi:MAG: histidine kinase [Saprospiraceae bacterium]|nr:histidine kinase [Saprospiraceae bacterium]
MKVRWRTDEMIMITLLVVWALVVILIEAYEYVIGAGQTNYETVFKANGLAFIYWRNVLFPQIGAVLLTFGVYLWINLIIIPFFTKVTGDDIERIFSKQIAKVVLSIVFVSFLFALGLNGLSYFARPHLFNYGNYQLLSIGGYNDQPLENIFFGFDRTLAFVTLVTLFCMIRELIIWFFEKTNPNRSFRIMVLNNIIPLIFLYFFILILINPLHSDFVEYLFFVTPLLGYYLYLMFWLFPFKSERSFFDKSVLTRLIPAAFIAIVPSIFLLFGFGRPLVPFLFLLLLLFVATPLFWFIYLQRKDKILQYIHMETALANSEANLQLLKSQINPHFLFNALNTLYGTALKGDTDQTAEGIQKLGDMMRFMLHENTLEFIPMEKEIAYLNNFITLQKLRIQSSPDIVVEDNIDEAVCNNQIAPMLFIPFVENAFKHGISLKEKSWIKINLVCSEDIVTFEVSNSLHKSSHILENGKSGIGLKNVKGRLDLQYPDNHTLEIQESENEYNIKLMIKC